MFFSFLDHSASIGNDHYEMATGKGRRRHVPMTRDSGAIVEGKDNVDVSLVLEEPIETARPSFGLLPQPENSVAKVEGC